MDKLSQKGVLYKIGSTQQINERLSKREFVLETLGEYPQKVQFETVNDRTALLDGLKEGQEVEVFFNLRGREWQASDGQVKYFNSLAAWDIKELAKATPSPLPPPSKAAKPQPPGGDTDWMVASKDADDDLPF